MNGNAGKAVLLSVTAVAFFLRVYQLDVNPPGLFKDEAFFGGLSYKLLETGSDFQGRHTPFLSNGHMVSILPLQMYPLVVSIFLFGFNEFGVRFLSVLFGTLLVVLAYLIARRLFDVKTALIAAALTAFSPWGVTYGRMYLGVLQSTFFFTLGLYLLVRGLDGDRSLFLLAGVSFGMTFFSYYLSHLFVVVFLSLFHFLFTDEIKKSGRTREYYIALSVVFVSLVASTVYSRLDVVVPVPPSTAIGVVKFFLQNLLEEVDVILRFKGGWDWPYYTSVSGVFYPVLIPFLVAGVLILLLDRSWRSLLPVYWLVVSLAVGALTSNLFVGSLRRALTCAGPAGEIVIACGIVRVFGYYSKDFRITFLLAALTVAGFTLGLYQFLDYYFVRQPSLIQTEMVSMTPVREVFNYTESVRGDYRRIYFTLNFDTTFWDNSNMTFEDYRVFYTRKWDADLKYVFGDVSSYIPGDGNLYIVRDFELANATPLMVFRYSSGEVAYKALA